MRFFALTTLFFVLGMTAIAEAATVSIQNNSGRQIDHVYISPASADRWGYDQLGKQDVILPGQTWRFTFEAGNVCYWDLRITFHDGHHHKAVHQDICNFVNPVWRINH